MPIDTDLARLARRQPDLDALNDFYDAVGFGRLLRNQAERIYEANRAAKAAPALC